MAMKDDGINRRDFLKGAVAGGAVATTAAAVVIYAPAAWPASAVDRAAALTAERIARFAAPADRA